MIAARQIIHPQNEEHWLNLRKEDLTSTEASVLFGCSRYSTLFETWHNKKYKLEPQREEKECIVWGQRLQDAIAKGIAQDKGWQIRRMDEYMRIPEYRLGASFDYEIVGRGILEIKNVFSLSFQEGWIVDGSDIEAPPDIEIQLQHQLAITEKPVGYIGALVGGNRLVLIEREPDKEVHQAIFEKSQSFWKSVDENKPPSPNFSEDAAFITRLYAQGDKTKVLNAKTDSELLSLALEYKRCAEIAKEAEQAKQALKAQMLTRIGDHGKVLGDGFSISAGEIKETTIESYIRKGYRDFRVNWKK